VSAHRDPEGRDARRRRVFDGGALPVDAQRVDPRRITGVGRGIEQRAQQ
jgi:hypothetical protein